MKEVLVKFPLSFSLNNNHLKHRKRVNSKLEQKVNFKFVSFLAGPIWVILINLGALSTASND
jgi:hypothetical protein